MTPSESTPAVPFPPIGNEYVVGVASAPLLSSDEASRLGRLVGEQVPQDVARQLGTALVAAVDMANSQFFRFELRTLADVTDEALLAVSDTTALPGLDQTHQTRKLTVVLPLLAGDDSVLRFPMLDRQVVPVPGTVVMYPAYLYALLEPIGSFTGIVLHAEGPAFR